jgi:hypothetical protein
MEAQMSDPTETDSVFLPAQRTLEDHLLTLRERCRVIADFFELHALALEGGARVELSPEACYGLCDLCTQSADDLQRLSKVLPGPILNHFPAVNGARPSAGRTQENSGPILI